MSRNIDWLAVLTEITAQAENEFGLTVAIERVVIEEIREFSNKSLSGFKAPNAAKFAGIVAFWIRKLKPLHVMPDSKNSFFLINEYISLKAGLAICEKYFDDTSKNQISINPRILRDWVFSFRYHSHSPNSSMISFEMLACDK